MKVIAGVVAGLIFAVIGCFFITTTFAASARGGAFGAVSFFVLWALAFVIAGMSPTGPKAWRRLLISSGILALLLPFAGMFYTSSYLATRLDPKSAHAGAEAVGAALGGTMITGMLGFVGFFLGVVLLVVGLLVGRDKQVVYVRIPADSQPNQT